MIYSYAPDFSNRYGLKNVLSFSTSSMYNGIGKISLILPIDDYYINSVNNGSLIYDSKSKESYIINCKKINTQNNTITANGYTSNSLLNQRVVFSEYKIKNVEADVYKLINDNLRGLPHIKTAEAAGLTDKINSVISCGQLADGCIRLLGLAELGNRMNWDDSSKNLTFEIFKGRDLTSGIHAAVFSYERGSAKNLVIADDFTVDKNTYYISGKLTDGTEILEIVGNENTGGKRTEKWCREVLSQKTDETEVQFRERLREKAVVASAKNIRRQNFNIEISAKDFGCLYNLGDIVSCVSTNFGVQFNARITGLNYTLDINGEKTALVLGEPSINIIEEERIRNE